MSLGKDRIAAILGKSGSGKSTLLRIINGMVIPDEGEVYLFGQQPDYAKMNEFRLRIGYVVQQAGLFPHMNIERNITLLGRICQHSKESNQQRFSQLMDMVQLPLSYAAKYPTRTVWR